MIRPSDILENATGARIFGRLLAGGGVVVLAAAAGAASGTAGSGVAPGTFGESSQRFAVSWADAQHGWRICRNATVCASDDGGRHWRQLSLPRAFRGNEVSALVRTSASAGVVAGTPPRLPVDWTDDGGHTWHRTKKLSGLFWGNASYLFSQTGPGLVQVTPWPPTGTTLTTRVAWTAPPGEQVFALATIPGGIAGIVSFAGQPLRLALLLHRLGANHVAELPKTNETGVDYLLDERLSADWPDLYITAQAYANTPQPPGNKHVGELFWHSTNAGKTWLTGLAS